MVKVIFYNLLRSKYKIKEIMVNPGSIHQIIEQIQIKHNNIDLNDFKTSVVFFNGNPIHFTGFQTIIPDDQEIIITHFVGGG